MQDLYFVFNVFVPGSSADGEGHIKDESSCSGWRDHGEFADTGSRPGTVDQKTEEDIWMEERKTKAMHVLSKLQDETRRKCNSNKGCSNFEDCESITWSRSHLTFTFHHMHFPKRLITCLTMTRPSSTVQTSLVGLNSIVTCSIKITKRKN